MSTIGAAQDMESEDLRRLYVNSVYWALGLESGIPQKADVNYVGGEWKASPFGGGKFRGGLKPADFAEKEAVVHAGFYSPSRKGQIWDTWAYFQGQVLPVLPRRTFQQMGWPRTGSLR